MKLKTKRKKKLSVPTLATLAATRGMLGAGIGMLAARRLRERRRKQLAWTLVGLGAASTVPLGYLVFRR